MTRAEKVTSELAEPIHVPVTDQDADDMKRYGIERVPVDYFHVAGFRYTSLKEAVAQARRLGPIAGLRS